jgi:crotonobetainyl-CoA:carnitine CoA-transferase CaiB-like acyl-CoA transferase
MSDSDAEPRSAEPARPCHGPLAGIRVLDLTRLLAGPFATMVMGDLGADVIKIENPDGGDDSRSFGPPHIGPDASYFMAVNRNKRSITVNLRDSAGRAAVQRMARRCDVVVENYRPGVADRLGLGYAELSRANPGIVYASISGYGQTGPYRDKPGYDATAQALSGMMSITGEPEGPPVRSGVSTADIGAGMWATIGILAALHERTSTGRGQRIDASLLDGQVSWLSYVAAAYLASGTPPVSHGSAHPTIVPYQVFATADENIMIAVANDAMWQRFIAAIGMEAVLSDSRFATNSARVARRTEVLELISDRLRLGGSATWLEALDAASVPACRVNSVADALGHPQVRARGMIIGFDRGSGCQIRVVGPGVRLSGHPAGARLPPPLLGEHTIEILTEFGFTPADIEAIASSSGPYPSRPAPAGPAAQ